MSGPVDAAASQVNASTWKALGMPTKAVLAACALAAAAAVLAGTRFGIGASPDSAAYLGAAKRLLEGEGLSESFGGSVGAPMTWFPPLYPALLAGLSLVSGDPTAAARWMGAGLFGLTATILAGIVAQSAPRRSLVPPCTAVLFLVTPSILRLHLMAWSEPLFLCLCAASLAFLIEAMRTGGWQYVLASGLSAGLACLTRYVGVTLFASGAVCLLLWPPKRLRWRVAAAGTYAALGAVPLAFWLARNAFHAATAAGRELSYHPLGTTHLWQAIDTLGHWMLLPDSLQGLLRVATVAAPAGLALIVLFAPRAKAAAIDSLGSDVVTRVLAAFMVGYGIGLALSVSLVDANTPFDDRILAPLYLGALGLAAEIALRLDRLLRLTGLVRLFGVGAWIVFVALSAVASAKILGEAYRLGLGFNRADWRHSPTMALVEQLPPDTLIVSNSPEAIYIRTGRSADRLPRRYFSAGRRVNEAYDAELQEMVDRVSDEAGAVVLFRAVTSASLPTATDLAALPGLRVAARTEDGVLYVAQTP